MEKKISTVCFTGHREIDMEDAINIPSSLKKVLRELILRGACTFKAGGAMGFDTVAALCVLELKEEFKNIELCLVLPCRDQTKMWNNENVKAYNYILNNADHVHYVADSYYQGCMHERNRTLVEGSDVCVAYLKKSHGGSAYTYALALSMGLEVINIYDIIKY